ncbi:MAG TPA: DUF434 domain-containing protein [Candidatus Hydrogenedentes bacterium]|nr:DUF434 domain-containing protein [Candidatus Hydrogenedentota bacterium]HNT88137.1 DUF434 domain-containing protein [Candidatus Hydrogenedentota bacterium]
MPSKQNHRGRHPADTALFAPEHVPRLREAVSDLSWLLTRGYSRVSALKLVGDHNQFAVRQRMAVDRCACSDASLAWRREHQVPCAHIRGETLIVDGYNLLITVESALAGGVLLRGRDGCIRDMASLRGSYRRVEETLPAIEHIGDVLATRAPARVEWYLDAPVSNSGRLKALLQTRADAAGWPWDIRLAPNPDTLLAASPHIVITADSWILDRAARWANVAPEVLDGSGGDVTVLDLST